MISQDDGSGRHFRDFAQRPRPIGRHCELLHELMILLVSRFEFFPKFLPCLPVATLVVTLVIERTAGKFKDCSSRAGVGLVENAMFQDEQAATAVPRFG